MQLLSTSKKTVLSDFADLETKSTYNHANGESTDFQFNAQRRIFIEINRNSGLEVMRIKRNELQRLRKLTIDNAISVSCAKQAAEEIAVGMANGDIKMYSYKTATLLHRYQVDKVRSSVIFLDYNCTDEYIASVVDSGNVSIYGNKTKSKIETLEIDGNSTLARFHPTFRFHLSIASYRGTVTVYDIQAKRNIFKHTDAHASPCRDICMSSTNPTTLISVGYDCIINIYDIRRKARQPNDIINYNHPLSTVAISDCGVYFCVGNLKGDLITYDMRNTKNYLTTRKVHDCAVMRIGFVPLLEENNGSYGANISTASDIKSGIVQNECKSNVSDLPKPTAGNLLSAQVQPPLDISLVENNSLVTTTARDSFYDFLDSRAKKALDHMPCFNSRRDSFDWDALTRKVSDEEIRQNLCQTNSGSSSEQSANTSARDSYDSKTNTTKHSAKLQHTLSGPLKDRSNASMLSTQVHTKLIQIDEEESSSTQPLTQNPHQYQQISADSSTSSDKENPQVEQELPGRFHILAANRYSTPHHGHQVPQSRKSMEGLLGTVKSSSSGVGKPSSMLSPIEPQSNIRKEVADLRNHVDNRLTDLETNLRNHIDERLTNLETELKFMIDGNKWQIYTHSSNLWTPQTRLLHQLRDGVALLMQNDEFVQEVHRIKQENTDLKAQLQQIQQ